MTDDTLQKSIGEAQHALDWNQLVRWRSGYGHVEGGPAARTGDLEVSVPGGATVLVDGDAVDVVGAENSVELEPDVDYPRWALVYVRDDGSVGVKHGDADTLYPSGAEPLEARVPAPPIGVDGTLYAAVWLRPNAVAVSDEEVFDRRFGAEAVLETAQVAVVEGEQASFQAATVDSEPSAATDVARKAETDAVQSNLETHEATDEAHGADGPIQGAADVDTAVASHREDDIHAKPQPPVNHADDHHSGGDDELDAAELSGTMGADEDVLVTDGEDAFWGTVPGALQEADFEMEHGSGSLTVDSTTPNYTTTVSFSNTYELAGGGAGSWSSGETSGEKAAGGGFAGWITSGNSITGMEIMFNNDTGFSNDFGYEWNVFGVPE